MAKHKLARFAENATFKNLFQHTEYDRIGEAFPLRGRWREDYFHNDRPIVLELGCGKGEYTIAMAKRFPERNYIGIDRKGARLWRGCKDAIEQELANVAFLRITIDHISQYFAPGEVDRIYINFCDPWPKSNQAKRRLTHGNFLRLYRRVLAPEGQIHFKSDNARLFAQTFYEKMWLTEGKTIHYVQLRIKNVE